jgi:hypothetical protein
MANRTMALNRLTAKRAIGSHLVPVTAMDGLKSVRHLLVAQQNLHRHRTRDGMCLIARGLPGSWLTSFDTSFMFTMLLQCITFILSRKQVAWSERLGPKPLGTAWIDYRSGPIGPGLSV